MGEQEKDSLPVVGILPIDNLIDIRYDALSGPREAKGKSAGDFDSILLLVVE
jgi:hypothetical protein